jgi:hypothetical protein
MAPQPASTKLSTNGPQVESVGMAEVGVIVVVAVVTLTPVAELGPALFTVIV